MDTVFLDANVLFSAAYRADAGLRKFWTLDVKLVSSAYAVEEARRNLKPSQREDLANLLRDVEVLGIKQSLKNILDVALSDKDRPILSSAVDAGATHLITGDVRHFGPLYGQRVKGVLVLSPAAYLAAKKAGE